MDGYEVKKIDSVIEKMDIVVTATGNKDIITGEHFKKMKDKTIVCNIGHFDNEIDISWLEENFSHQKTEIKPQVDLYKINNGVLKNLNKEKNSIIINICLHDLISPKEKKSVSNTDFSCSPCPTRIV